MWVCVHVPGPMHVCVHTVRARACAESSLEPLSSRASCSLSWPRHVRPSRGHPDERTDVSVALTSSKSSLENPFSISSDLWKGSRVPKWRLMSPCLQASVHVGVRKGRQRRISKPDAPDRPFPLVTSFCDNDHPMHMLGNSVNEHLLENLLAWV